MNTQRPDNAQPLRALVRLVAVYPLQAASLLAMLLLMVGATFFYADTPPLPPTVAAAPAPTAGELSNSDSQLVQNIFRAQDRHDFADADALISQMSNPILLGHILAQRYLDNHYNAVPTELALWMAHYSDHPEAAKIRALALRKGVSAKEIDNYRVTDVAPLKGSGYAEQLGRSAMPDAFYRGLAQWKAGATATALAQFASAADGKLTDWQKSAAYYWAYRAAGKLGQQRDALAYLTKAGQYPTSFYGQLANQQLGDRDGLIVSAPYVPSQIRESAPAQRALALVAANQRELAEDELRQLVMLLDKSDRPAVLSLAGEMGLANLQVRLAALDGLSPEQQLYANYPVPPWFVSAQKVVDSSLLLSIARQESVFRDDVKSNMGATGMLQMLPSTARHVEAHLGVGVDIASADNTLPLSKQLNDSDVMLNLGAQYLSQLAHLPMVQQDAIRLIASYNAGPGSVQSWQAMAKKVSDPLLYIESIPYPETRNYVMQVLAHQWVYQTLRGEQPTGLISLARGQWPVERV